MHVALYFPDRLPVQGYGGTQRVVVWLARGLAELGHRVTLIAGPGSAVPEARLVPVDVERARRGDCDLAPHVPADADILHAHAPVRRDPGVPFVWTLHGNTRPGRMLPANTIFLSADHAHRHGGTTWVHNGIDPAEYRFVAQKEGFDLFLGRLSRVKGWRWAVAGAKRSRRRLLVAGGWRPSLSRYVRFVGEVDGERKARLLGTARCLWMPAQWDEPFGLTLVEAMMSGTPVLATRRGALPEIITPDVGALGDTLDELVEAARGIERIDPYACRARAERVFGHRVMAAAYVRVYERYLATGMVDGPAAP